MAILFLPTSMRIGLLLLACILAATVVSGAESFYQPSARSARQNEVIYFLLPDRFNDGDPANNKGNPDSDEADRNGFDPSDPHFFHGGLAQLGITSIWMTPIFRNRAVQEFGQGVPPKAGYHGYWILDFTEVDPHFGSKEDLERLIERAKANGIGIILDIVVNHTADVIQPKSGLYAYKYKFSKPYLNASGATFDDCDYINKPRKANIKPFSPAGNSAVDRLPKRSRAIAFEWKRRVPKRLAPAQ